MLIAVDDSDFPLGGKKHIILAAILFHEPEEVIATVEGIKADFSLKELKWNSKGLTQIQREEVSSRMLGVLSQAHSFVLIREGHDKQAAAEDLVQQIAESLDMAETGLDLELHFDIGIISNERMLSQKLQSLPYECMRHTRFSSVNSLDSNLIQCADLFAGFIRLQLDLLFSRKDKIIFFGEEYSPYDELPLSRYVSLALRYSLYGEVVSENLGDLDNLPFKYAKGKGLRIISSVSDDLLDEVYGRIGVSYMGCIH